MLPSEDDLSLLVHDNHVYLPVFKNASTTHIQFLSNLGWKHTPIRVVSRLSHKYKIFGHIQDPWVRYSKGIVELILNDVIPYDPDWSRAILTDISDQHLDPISMTYNELSQQAHWIPLDLRINDEWINSNNLTNLYFEHNDLPFRITNAENMHLAHYSKKTLQKICLDYIKNNKQKLSSFFDSRFSVDQALWETAIRYYSNMPARNLLEKH